MDESLRLHLSLHSPPQVVAASAAAVHGERGTETYRLERLWCLNFYQGEGVLRLRGQDFPFHSGCASITPPGTDYRFSFTCRTVKTWIHFAPQGVEETPLAIMQDLGPRFAHLRGGLAEACTWLHSEPERATARVWDVLWSLASPQTHSQALHPGLATAIEFIEQQLENPLAPIGIARKCGLSPTHLNRLFRQHFGQPVMDHVRSRRAARAVHLLTNTTLPIGRIGELVGIPDPHLFNKSIRAVLGQSPRAIRQGT